MLVEEDKYEVPEEQELFSLKKVEKAKKRSLCTRGDSDDDEDIDAIHEEDDDE